MNTIKKLLLVCSFFLIKTVVASDFVTIATPANGSTVSGSPFTITGSASRINNKIQCIIDGVDIGSLMTNGLGAFSLSFASISSGSHTLTMNLLDSNSATIATASTTFTVTTVSAIAVTSLVDGDTILSNPMVVAGTSSLTSTTVKLSVDGSGVGTTTTDSSGNWSISTNLITNGSHTLLAELQVSGITVASFTLGIQANIVNRLVKGVVLTSGSGSGVGYSYTVSGSLVTITYSPAFANAPIVTTTGLRLSGSSTITIASSTATAVTLGFSTGTTSIHFTATAFS